MLYNHRLSPSSSSADLLEEFEKDSKILNAEYVRRRNRALLYSLLICSIFFAGLLVGFAGIKIPNAGPINVCAVDTLHVANTCRDATLRREWRSLDTAEKMDYIRAVKCLKTLPSQLQLNQSLYDDFPWVHKRFGEYAHDAAPFLAWHRYFIHTYERKLKEQCDYQGHLTYWDWTLDWENITMSPVWDADTGFGGSGNVEVDSPILKAHCVTEGAFANLEVLYFEDIYKPHCLLRGFDGNLEDFRGELEPTSVMKLLLSPDYGSINLGLEHGPHVAIPKSVNGDFSLHTAPSDPVFFLHHTQLDRIWWRWQQIDASTRLMEYTGKASTNSTEKASLENIMPMGALASDIKVGEVMSTESDLLCYRY